MSWTVPFTLVDGDPLTAAQLNTLVRDNLLETGPGKATREGRLLVTDAVHRITERQWARSYRGSGISVDAQFPTNEGVLLGTETPEGGPTVTVEHGGSIMLFYDARIRITAGDGSAAYAPIVNGASPENTNTAVRSDRTYYARASGYTYVELDEPGTAEITMAYGCTNTSTTAEYTFRRLTAFPF